MLDIYTWDATLPRKGMPKRSILEVPRILTKGLAAISDIQATFSHYRLNCMAAPPYGPAIG